MFKSRMLPVAAVMLSFAGVFCGTGAAQTPIVPLDTLVANGGSITAGDVTFSHFQKPLVLLRQVGAFLTEFNDIGVTATAKADGTVMLQFVGMDPVTGLAKVIAVGPDAGGDILRLLSYTTTVTNPALRLHSVMQGYGPLTGITGSSLPFNLLYTVEPKLVALSYQPVDGLREDYYSNPNISNYQTLLPGGNPPSLDLENEFGILKGHLGFPAGATLDSIDITFTLAPAGSPVPVVVPNLIQAGDYVRMFSTASTGYPNGFFIEPVSGILQLGITDYAQDGGAVIALSTNNPAAFPLPASVTIPQGSYLSPSIVLGPTNVDFPIVVALTATYNGRTQTQNFTAKPPTPLTLSIFAGVPLCGSVPCTLNTWMRVFLSTNRVNVAPETITLSSSNPAVCPVPASYSLAAFSQAIPVFELTCKAVAADTPITFTATMNGVSTATTAVLYRSTDNALISKAELVVKNLSLKVDATNQVPGDTMTLYNNATGQLIGNMTFTGLTGTSGKYQFQGTIAGPVGTLLLRTGLNGSTTFVVSQK